MCEPDATDAHVLDLEILVDALGTALAAEPGLLHASERRLRVRRQRVVRADDAVLERLRDAQQTRVTDSERCRQRLDEGRWGDNVGVRHRGIKKTDVERGQVLAKPGSVKPHKKFKAEIYVLSKDEGGRHTPFFTNYRPQFYFRTTDVTGSVTLPTGVEMVMPGDNVSIEVELSCPVAMEKTMRFAIREGGKTVGAGRVTEIIA
mgnify:CR=1 FL=1